MREISLKQYACLLFMLAVSVKVFMLPALMLRITGKTALIVMFIFILLELFGVFVTALLIRKNPRKTIFMLINDFFGKVISKIIIAFFGLFLLAKCVLIISEIKMFFTVTMYEEIIWPIMILPLIAVLFSIARKRLRGLGRTAEILAPIVIICTLILFTLLVEESELTRLLPVLEDGFSPVIKGLLAFPMWFGNGFILLLFVGKTKNSEKVVKVSLISYSIASVLVLAFTAMLCSTYANIGSLIDYGNNVSNMTQFSLSSQDYGRFDLLFFCAWMFSVIITLAVSFAFFTRSAQVVTGGKRNIVVLVCCVIIYIISSFILSNENVVYITMTGAVKYFLTPLPALIPIVLLLKRKKKRNEEEKTA